MQHVALASDPLAVAYGEADAAALDERDLLMRVIVRGGFDVRREAQATNHQLVPDDHLPLDAVAYAFYGHALPIPVPGGGQIRRLLHLLPPRPRGLKPRPARRVFGLHVDDPELTVLAFANGGHHPEEIDRAAGRGDVRVIALRHDHQIAFAHDDRKLGLARVGIDQLNAPGGRRHVDVEVSLFEHR